MARFFSEMALSAGSTIALGRDESHHLHRVLRMTDGEAVIVIDGKGKVAQGVILSSSAKESEIKITQVTVTGPRSSLIVGFGIPKGPAQDFIFRRVTELGVRGFLPLGTEHSLKAKDFNEERWQRVIPEIAKQCEETVFPVIFQAVPLEKGISPYSGENLFFCDENQRAPKPLIFSKDRSKPNLILIGPEGGWSSKERALISGQGAQLVSLGQNRLRAETACFMAVALLKERLGELCCD